MNDEYRKQLIEQYEDAALALLMDEYAETDGERLQRDFEAAEQAGAVPDVPDALDRKCRQLIQNSFNKQKRNAQLRKLSRSAVKAAAFLMILLGLATTMVLSVDALRTPVLRFFLRHEEQYTSITFSEPTASLTPEEQILEKIRSAPIPEGYALTKQEINNGIIMLSFCENALGKEIWIEAFPASGVLNVDSEDAEYTETTINGYQAFYIEKDGYCITWCDDNLQTVFTLRANGLSKDDFWKLASALSGE